MNQFKSELHNFVKKKNIIDRSIKYFWRNFNSYIEENKEEASEAGLTDRSSVILEEPCVRFGFFENDEELVSISIVFENSKHQYIGYYQVFFDLSGNCVDDVFFGR